MRIGVYIRNNLPSAGGAYTLVGTIMREALSAKSEHELLFFFDDDRGSAEKAIEGFRFINCYTKRSVAEKAKLRLGRLLGRERADRGLDELLARERVDFLWILGPYEVDVSIPYAFTVWDLGHRIHPEFPELDDIGWSWEARERLYQKMLYRATYVITGNETGKREILENYPMPPEKIKVVPFPIPSFCRDAAGPAAEVDPRIREPFVFYPAQFWSHKNHVALVEAVRYLRDERGTSINCYFVGSNKGNESYIRKKIDEYGLGSQVLMLGFVDDPTLRYLYTHATAMAFVSLLGPNNLPPIEAVALDCPVIISDLPGHIEQMGDAALAVDATDYTALGEAILLLCRDSERRDSLILKGRALAKAYEGYSYFSTLLEIVNSFAPLRNTWG